MCASTESSPSRRSSCATGVDAGALPTEKTIDVSTNPSVTEMLRLSVPFAALPDALLVRISTLGRRAHYRDREPIYDAGSAAEHIYVVLAGKVEHSFDPGRAVARDLVKIVGPSAVFGWGALLKPPSGNEPPIRLAKTTSLGESEVLIIDAGQLMAALDAEPGAKEAVLSRFASMVRHLYGFAGFVKVRDQFVPAHIRATDPGTAHDYDTFAF